MKLSELIEETLNEIAIGIKKSRETSQDIIAVAPGKFGGKFAPELTDISFDVALVVTDAADQKSLDKSGLSGSVKVASILSIGGDVGKQSEDAFSKISQNTQRISFKIPICLSTNYQESQKSKMVISDEAMRKISGGAV